MAIANILIKQLLNDGIKILKTVKSNYSNNYQISIPKPNIMNNGINIFSL